MPIDLHKGSVVSLAKADGTPLTAIKFGLRWTGIPKKIGGVKSVDLDASVFMLDSGGHEVDSCWYRKLRSSDGSCQHSGDNLTGQGGGSGQDLESIAVDLRRVAANVAHLFVVVNAYSGHAFSQVATSGCRLYDASSGSDVVIGDFQLAGEQGGNYTGFLMARVSRVGSGWQATILGLPGSGRDYNGLVPLARLHMAS